MSGLPQDLDPVDVHDEQELWAARLERVMFPAIEAWFQRTLQAPVTPAPGSLLALDGLAYPRHPSWRLAYGGMVTAAEHLDLFRVALMSSKMLYPASYFTLLRSALMGSTQALWILQPPQREKRIENTLRLVREDIKQNKSLLSEGILAALGLTIDATAAQTRLDERLAELQAAAAAIGLDPDRVPQWALNMTNMIKTVSDTLHAADPSDDITRHVPSLLWRLQSGHAHATPSARLRQIQADLVEEHSDGTLTAAATTTFVDIGSNAAAPFLFLHEAWRLYELGCAAP